MKNNRTFLEKLLDGAEVQYGKLSDVLPIKRGKRVVRNELDENGIYPVYQNSLQPLGYFNNKNCEAYTTFIIAAGAAGEIGFSEVEFWAADDCYYFECPKEVLNNKFLYYVLMAQKHNLLKKVRKASIPRLGKDTIEKLSIPIPPLSVQTEIVKILDALTALTSELTSELTLRRKQYEYYREKLLSVDNLKLSTENIQWVKLNDLGELIRGNGLQKKDFTETGVPAIHYGQIYTYYGTFATETKSFVSPELAKKLKKAKYGDVLIAGTSENVKDVMKPLGWFGSKIAFSGDMFAFRPNKKVNTKYLTYILQTEKFYKFKEKYAQGTKVIRVRADNFLNYEIPLPPFEEQQRIVSILDKFETLTNSITEGLPLAIEQSQKRYEYYRELLLSF